MMSTEIAKLTGKRHDHVLRDIRSIIEQLKDSPKLGGVFLESEYKAGNNKKEFCYKMDYSASILVITGYSVEARARVINRWQILEQKELERQKDIANRQSLRLEYRPMTDAIKEAYKDVKFWHYSSEADLINRVALGCTAKQFKEKFDVESVRDNLTPQLKACILAMQRANTVYIEDGLSFDERHEKLESLYNRKWADKIYEEHILLEA